MKAFQIKINDRQLDYRIGEKIDLEKVKSFFTLKGYTILNFIDAQRHVCAIVEKAHQKYFLKLSTSEGISVVTENEAKWNDQASDLLSIPKSYDRGYFNNKYFYLITSFFDGPVLTSQVIQAQIDKIIDLSEKIMGLDIADLPSDSYNLGKNYKQKFINKTRLHFESIPKSVRDEYLLENTFGEIQSGNDHINQSPRHGDFAPWHMIFSNNKINLIDGEHAMNQGVKYYDIAYFIQRVYAVSKEKILAQDIYKKIINRNYDKRGLKIVLLARAIGGFLDESLSPKPDYRYHEDFKNWINSL